MVVDHMTRGVTGAMFRAEADCPPRSGVSIIFRYPESTRGGGGGRRSGFLSSFNGADRVGCSLQLRGASVVKLGLDAGMASELFH